MSKWKVSKDALEKAIRLISMVPSMTGIGSSEFIKVTKGKNGIAVLSMCSQISGNIALKADGEYPFETLYLDRRVFLPFVAGGKESKSETYFFADNKSKLLIQHGNRKALYVKPKEITGYENPEEANYSKLAIDKKWAQLVRCASCCATTDPVTPTLNCVYIKSAEEHLQIMSTNQSVVFQANVKVKAKLKDVIAFPLPLVDVLATEGARSLSWTDKLAVVSFSSGKLWSAVKSKARTGFPHTRIAELTQAGIASEMVCEINGAAFAKAIDRLSGYVSPLGFDDMVLTIEIAKGSKKVTLKSGSEHNVFSENIFAIKEPKADLTLEWPFNKVLPAILYSKDAGSIRIHLDKNKQSTFVTNEIVMVIAKSE